LIYGLRGNVLTLDDNDRFLIDHVVLIDGKKGVIVDVVPREKASEYAPEFVYGSNRHLITPGLVNTHTHIPMYIFKNVSIRKTGLEWLKQVWSMESCLKPKHVYYGSLLALIELIENGITLYGDMYFYEEEVANASRELGVRASLSLGVIELFEGPPKHTIEESIRFARSLKEDSLVRGMIGVHALYSVTSDSIRKAVEASKDLGLRIHMHFAESLDEVRYVREKYGKTPTELAEDLGLLTVKPLLAHAVYVDDKDLEVLSRRAPYVSYCPFTIMSWGSGIARVLEFLEKGIPVTMGTDGPMTAGTMNLLFELKVGLAAQGSKYGRPLPLDLYSVLKMSVIEGSRALGWDYRGIVNGGVADLVAWLAPRWVDFENMTASDAAFSLVYDYQSYKADYVVVSGRIVNKSEKFEKYRETLYEKIRDIRKELLECGQK
jgi:5-methylthioadenosine/S-adenosylhomocysteine deaminase